MDYFTISGKNYFGSYKYVRKACRAFIIKNDMILTSYESKSSHYMLPGGGLEEGESDEECIIREVNEETGIIIEPLECLLQLEELYEDTKYVSKYFTTRIVGKGNIKLTPQEVEVGLEPRWLNIDEAINMFSKYNSEAIEEWRGLYEREYFALINCIDKIR